jgi:hemoglobin-like flavoprotein
VNARQIQLLRDSFAQLAPSATLAGALFYDKLFERDPSVGALFDTDMAAQSRRLFEMVGDALALLDHPDELDAVLQVLGARHAAYGVRDDHYDTVGAALLDTLEAALDEAFTPQAREAWAGFYARISRLMRQGASNPDLAVHRRPGRPRPAAASPSRPWRPGPAAHHR